MRRRRTTPGPEANLAARKRMVREQLVARGVRDAATLEAMASVPRESFVGDAAQANAYEDRALAIGRGQTISQPYMVARMTECLRLVDLGWPWTTDPPTLLDVGTGSGYQAAVLARTGARVTSVERDPELAERASERLNELGYVVDVVVADGSLGYEPASPYAGIIVAAATPALPVPLLEQLAEGGRLVAPVGSRGSQRLTVARRSRDAFEEAVSEACVFVPLVGAHGYHV